MKIFGRVMEKKKCKLHDFYLILNAHLCKSIDILMYVLIYYPKNKIRIQTFFGLFLFHTALTSTHYGGSSEAKSFRHCCHKHYYHL